MLQSLPTRAATLALSLAAFASLASAAEPSCTSVASVRSCASSISGSFARTASMSRFCSSVLGCPAPATTTLTGTVTQSVTSTITESYTWEEIGTETTTTLSYDYTETSTTYFTTVTATITSTQEKWVITTPPPRPSRRDGAPHPKDLGARAITSVCPSAAQKSACSCIYACPSDVTRDRRRTITERYTDTAYDFTTQFITYTNTEYEPTLHTVVESATDESTHIVKATRTRTIKCTPGVPNSSFYLSATVSPVPTPSQQFVDKYVYAEPSQLGAIDPYFSPQYAPAKDVGSVFYLDSQARLVTPSSYGNLYANIDYFNDFQLVNFMSRQDIRTQEYLFLACALLPPSGRFAGGYRELDCIAYGAFNPHIFQWCPIYDDFFGRPTVLGSYYSPEAPACFNITFLAVPVCG
ncbi:hypothetical protein S7711_01713 [Stachybotrys chartarum IBT 7711]|uniref:Ig-like domain-containing protein n=1 Tax=Stachybotrys chartarum (strain CBS 109288 / IBT 7711) TaxID=1280523 RepID=A0A084AVD3_STACB|nr:hypothetical protein S7711_01713 [Stachybotrys chartarum IBT 7711]